VFDKLAQELFQILKGNGKTLTLFDDEGTQIYKPEDARKFFAEPDNFVISINENGTDSAVAMYLSQSADIAANSDLRNLADTLRNIATRYNVLFNVRKYARELRPKDFAFQAEVKESIKVSGSSMETNKNVYILPIHAGDNINNKLIGIEYADLDGNIHQTNDQVILNRFTTRKKLFRVYPEEVVQFVKELTGNDKTKELEGVNMNTVQESKLPQMSGSIKTTYQKIGEARLIIRHSSPVKEGVHGSRSRNIRSIFIETKIGERVLYPYNHLAGARAMAHHLSESGKLSDDVGMHIVTLSEEYSKLSSLSSHIIKNIIVSESVSSIRECVRERAKDIRTELSKVVRNYTSYMESFDISNTLIEGDLGDEVSRLASLLNLTEGSAEFDALKYAAPYTVKSAVVEKPATAAVAPVPAPANPFTTYAQQWLAKTAGTLGDTSYDKRSDKVYHQGGNLNAVRRNDDDQVTNVIDQRKRYSDAENNESSVDITELATSLKNIAQGKFSVQPKISKNARFTDPDAEYRIKLDAWAAPTLGLAPVMSTYVTYLTDKLANGRKLTPNEKFFADKMVAAVGLKEGFAEEHNLDEWFEQFDPMSILTQEAEDESDDYDNRKDKRYVKNIANKAISQDHDDETELNEYSGEHDKKSVAIQTLSIDDSAKLGLGMSKQEARAYLKSIGYSNSDITSLEGEVDEKIQGNRWVAEPHSHGHEFDVSRFTQKRAKTGQTSAFDNVGFDDDDDEFARGFVGHKDSYSEGIEDPLGGDEGDELVADIKFHPEEDHDDPEMDELEASLAYGDCGSVSEGTAEFDALAKIRKLAGV